MATVGVWQAEANRAKFRGMPVNDFAGYAEGVRQFTDRIISGSSSESVILGNQGARRAAFTHD